MAKVVDYYSTLYRMSERNFRRYIKAGQRGAKPMPSEYGTAIGIVDFVATDADQDRFECVTLDSQEY